MASCVFESNPPEGYSAMVNKKQPKRSAGTAVTTTVRLRLEHLEALHTEAMRRKVERGGAGKADASAVLRSLLDEWLSRR